MVSRLDRKAKKIAAILEISRALNEAGHPSVLFQLIVDRATELMGASSGSVILIERESGVLRIEAERGLGEGVKETMRLSVGQGITGWAARPGSRRARGPPVRGGEPEGAVRNGGADQVGGRGRGRAEPGSLRTGGLRGGGPGAPGRFRERGRGGLEKRPR